MKKVNKMLSKGLLLYIKKNIFVVLILSTNIFCYDYSMSFLKLPITARQASMQAYSSLSDDTGGIFCNPAGLTNVLGPYSSFTHTEYLQNIKYESFGYIHPLKNKVLFLGISALYTTRIEGRSGVLDFNREYINLYQMTQPEFYYDVYDVQTSFGISKFVYKNISLGFGLKFLYEKIYDVYGFTVATDFGLQYYPEKIKYIGDIKNLTLSLNVNNLGLPVKYVEKYYNLPTTVILGGSYKKRIGGFYTTVAIDYVLPFYDTGFILLGVEILLNEYISVRCGYKISFKETHLEEFFPGLSLGTGIDYFGVKLDYSTTSYGVLGLTHKVTLSLEIDKLGKFYKLLREKLFKFR